MADNIEVSQGIGTTVATDEIGGAHYQQMKINLGGDGIAIPASGSEQYGLMVDVTRMPEVGVTGTFYPEIQPVSGTLSVIGDFYPETQLVSGTVNAVGTFYQAIQPVSGTVTIQDGGGSITVDGAFYQAIQPVSGTVTIQDGGNSITIDGNIGITSIASGLYIQDYPTTRWSATATASGTTEVKAYPNDAALSHYVTDIIFSNGATAGSVIIQCDTGSAKTTLVGPLYLAANGGAVINLRTPIKATANKNIGYTSTTITTMSCTINGFTAI